MSDATVVAAVSERAANNWVTWFGLCLSLFSMVIIRQAFHTVTSEPGTTLVVTREMCMFASAGVLVWLVLRQEKRPLRSIGIGTSRVWKSLVWGVVIAVACIVPAALVAKVTGYGHSGASQAFTRLPTWVVLIVVVRSGVVEELFYRGYSIERLKGLGFGPIASWMIPLVIFSAAHWAGGAANVVLALLLGSILTAFYQWRHDLVSNISGHFLVDFVANVLPAIFS